MSRKCFLRSVALLALMISTLLVPVAVLGKPKEVRQVVIQEVTRVEGKIQKPEVWYLLPRSNLNFEGVKLEEKLVPKIEEAIKQNPF